MDTFSIAPWKDEDLEPVMDLWQRVFADRSMISGWMKRGFGSASWLIRILTPRVR